MTSFIKGSKESIAEIILQSQLRFKKYSAEENMLKFAIVAYRDHEPQDTTFITKTQNFSSSNEIINFLDNLTASGGGDPPEAVLDGLNEAVFNLNWRSDSEKILFLLLDNPGHGIRFGTNYDCPCGLHENIILNKMKEKEISFHIIRPNEINIKLDKMIELFSKYVEIDILELDTHKKSKYYSDTKVDPVIENRIFGKGRFSSSNFKNKPIIISKKYYSSDESSFSSNEDISSMKIKKRSRSRSKDKSPYFGSSVGKEIKKKYMVPMVNISELDLLAESKKYNFNDKMESEIIYDNSEDLIESNIKDHISKIVIDKLERCLNLNDK